MSFVSKTFKLRKSTIERIDFEHHRLVEKNLLIHKGVLVDIAIHIGLDRLISGEVELPVIEEVIYRIVLPEENNK